MIWQSLNFSNLVSRVRELRHKKHRLSMFKSKSGHRTSVCTQHSTGPKFPTRPGLHWSNIYSAININTGKSATGPWLVAWSKSAVRLSYSCNSVALTFTKGYTGEINFICLISVREYLKHSRCSRLSSSWVHQEEWCLELPLSPLLLNFVTEVILKIALSPSENIGIDNSTHREMSGLEYEDVVQLGEDPSRLQTFPPPPERQCRCLCNVLHLRPAKCYCRIRLIRNRTYGGVERSEQDWTLGSHINWLSYAGQSVFVHAKG